MVVAGALARWSLNDHLPDFLNDAKICFIDDKHKDEQTDTETDKHADSDVEMHQD